MKKFCIIFLSSIIISVMALGFSGSFASESARSFTEEYLRIHIRADDNDQQAQAVKFAVRDAVVEYLTPVVAECRDKEASLIQITNRLNEIAQVADATLKKHGFYYGANAEVKRETFPTRVYGECTLPSGEYTALIIRLGRGLGDNWWCVVYPPLCFTGGGKVEYKSKILEIIQNWEKG